jgi:hypothetical protein
MIPYIPLPTMYAPKNKGNIVQKMRSGAPACIRGPATYPQNSWLDGGLTMSLKDWWPLRPQFLRFPEAAMIFFKQFVEMICNDKYIHEQLVFVILVPVL